MALSERSCNQCGTRYTPKRSTSKYCSVSCNKRASRVGRAGGPSAGSGSVTAIGSRPPGPGDVERAARADLDAIEQTESTLGAAILALARKIDKESDTGSALASMISQLRTVMSEAKAAGVAPERTVVGGLRLVRDQIRAGA